MKEFIEIATVVVLAIIAAPHIYWWLRQVRDDKQWSEHRHSIEALRPSPTANGKKRPIARTEEEEAVIEEFRSRREDAATTTT